MTEQFYGTQAWKRLRRAILERDRVCQIPGCDRPAELAIISARAILAAPTVRKIFAGFAPRIIMGAVAAVIAILK
jgi:hypothetical protein